MVGVCQAVVLCIRCSLQVHPLLLQLAPQRLVVSRPVLARPDALRRADLLAVLRRSCSTVQATQQPEVSLCKVSQLSLLVVL